MIVNLISSKLNDLKFFVKCDILISTDDIRLERFALWQLKTGSCEGP